jgi:hypothetical protein
MYGGEGTAHMYHRIPTHCGIDQLMFWLILNRPEEKKVYLVNAWDENRLHKAIYHIMGFDRDPVIIQITAKDKHYNQLGNINAITKWPLFFEIMGHYEKYNIDFNNLDKNNLAHRNTFVKYYDEMFTVPDSIDFDNIKEIKGSTQWPFSLEMYKRWFTLRNLNNPHEVNAEQFALPPDNMKNLYNLDLADIYSDIFPNILESLFENTNAGDFDFNYIKSFHQNYIDAQPHLKFIEEINEFKKTKVLTEYLNSHPLLQALVIKEIYDQLPTDWESKTLQEIVKAIQ